MAHIPTHAEYFGGDFSQIMDANPSWGSAELNAYMGGLSPSEIAGITSTGLDPSAQAYAGDPVISQALQNATTSKAMAANAFAPGFKQAFAPTVSGFDPVTEGYDYSNINIDEEFIRTPEQQFLSYASGAFRPGFERNLFYGQLPQLQQRWLLDVPSNYQSFGQFLGGGETQRLTGPELRNYAQQIANMQAVPQADWAAGEYETTLSPLEAGLFRRWYGPNEDNVLALAQTVALQRGAGLGQYQGILGTAISGVISDLHNVFMGENPGGNFLEWYLDRSAPGQRLSFQQAAAPPAPPAPGGGTPSAGQPYPVGAAQGMLLGMENVV